MSTIQPDADPTNRNWPHQGRRRRRRVQRHPPDFEAETEHARAWLELHAGMWSPELRDIKRLDEGRTALLFRDRHGTRLEVVVRGGRILDCGTAERFRSRREVLT